MLTMISFVGLIFSFVIQVRGKHISIYLSKDFNIKGEHSITGNKVEDIGAYVYVDVQLHIEWDEH